MSNFTIKIGPQIHTWNCRINPFFRLPPGLWIAKIVIFHNRLSVMDPKQGQSVRKHCTATLKQLYKTHKEAEISHRQPSVLGVSWQWRGTFWRTCLKPNMSVIEIQMCLSSFSNPLVVQAVNNPLVMQETQVRSLDQKDPLEKGMATHASILAWRTSWTEKPGCYMESHGVGPN